MYKNKQYLDTWVICLLFALWFLIVPGILGLILLLMQMSENKKLVQKYGEIDNLDKNLSNLKAKNAGKMKHVQEDLDALLKEKYQLECEIESLENDTLCQHFNFSDYSGLTSEECKNKLSLLKIEEQEAIKNQNLITVTSTETKKVINSNIKQLLRCFNAECDNILLGLSHKNIDTSRNKITKSFETLNKIFVVDGIQLSHKALDIKLEQLNLVYSYELKSAQEKELQKEIKAQMIEEEKARKDIEKRKAQIQKDEKQVSGEINRMMKYLQKTDNDIEKNLYLEKIQELENKLKELEAEKENVLEREANAKAGFVYVISNIGSFGNDVYKIGMTRRLEPMDRIKELSSASVPFEFDVHAMIFSDNAPELENILHKHFESRSVNRVNLRKEFFKVSLDEIEEVVTTNFDKTVEFTRIPVASEYRQTLNIIESESVPEPDELETIAAAADSNQTFSLSQTELDILDYIKELLHTNDEIVYRKTSNYLSMELGENAHKWLCRVYIRQKLHLCVLHKFNDTDYECEYYFDDPCQLKQIEDIFRDVLLKCSSL